jgi:uncharacterized membrane protein YdbT with pleckstrin-like domain
MGYVKQHLLPGEQVVYETRLHKFSYLLPLCLAAVGVVFFFVGNDTHRLAWFLLLSGLVWGLFGYIDYTTSEFAVTNRRVILKTGVFRTRALELQKSQIESVAINQGMVGQSFGYGNIVVGGTGGTKETFKYIANPFELRNAVHADT